MKVVHLISDASKGGAAVAAARLNDALISQGIDSTILALNKGENNVELKGFAQGLKNKINFFLERFFLVFFYNWSKGKFAYSPGKFGNNITSNPLIKQAEVIHIHWINFGFLSIRNINELVALNKKIVWTFHDQWAFTGGCHYTYECTNFISGCTTCPLFHAEPLALSKAGFKEKAEFLPQVKVICPSTWMLEEAVKSPIINKENSIRIPYPINLEKFKPINIDNNRFGLDSTKKYLLFGAANTADPRKGAKYLKEALLTLKDKNLNLIVFGKNSFEIPEAEINIINIGEVKEPSELIELYSLAEVMIVPSLADNLPNVVIEALACGTPTVAFKIGGMPDMISHKHNGYLAEVKSASDLANGINWCLENNKQQQLSKNARNYALKEFSEEKIAKDHLRFYAI